VTDHTTLDPELGSEVEFEGLTRALKGHGMGLLIDVVPNHRGIMDASNLWWQEVLEDGPSSHCAHFFDFDWVPPKENVAHKILLPILGDQYDLVLEDGDLQLCLKEERSSSPTTTVVRQLTQKTSTAILSPALERVWSVLEADNPYLVELESITLLKVLPSRRETDPEVVRVRRREMEVAKRRLAVLVEMSENVREAFDAVVTEINDRRGDPGSFDRLEAFLADQVYHLCYRRVAGGNSLKRCPERSLTYTSSRPIS
jgi:(1->4)-alpha-D-glucan 1-alpha-D-glucosylmutase